MEVGLIRCKSPLFISLHLGQSKSKPRSIEKKTMVVRYIIPNGGDKIPDVKDKNGTSLLKHEQATTFCLAILYDGVNYEQLLMYLRQIQIDILSQK